MDLRNREYAILGSYFVMRDTHEVYSESGKLLGILPKANMTQHDITLFLQKPSEKTESKKVKAKDAASE